MFCFLTQPSLTARARALLRRHAHTHAYFPPPFPSDFDSPAFLSFLFRYTEKMTKRLPRMSTTIVKMRKHPKVVVTHGGRFRTVSLGSGEELFRWDPFVTIVYSRWTFSTGPNSTCSRSRCVLKAWISETPVVGYYRLPRLSSSSSPRALLLLLLPRVDFPQLPWINSGRLPLSLVASVSLLRPCAIHFVGTHVWHEAATSNLPSMWSNSPERSGFILREKHCRPVAESWKSDLMARKAPYFFSFTGCVFIHGFAVARFAVFQQPIHYHFQESFMFSVSGKIPHTYRSCKTTGNRLISACVNAQACRWLKVI